MLKNSKLFKIKKKAFGVSLIENFDNCTNDYIQSREFIV